MVGTILYGLIWTALGSFIMYLIIKAAIDHSALNDDSEIRALKAQNNSQFNKINTQLNEITHLLKEQNELLRTKD